MKNILILGANGNIAKFVTAELADNKQITLLKTSRTPNEEITPLDVLDQDQLNAFLAEHPVDLVYANLGVHGHQDQAAENVVTAMTANNVTRLIWVATAGIYGEIAPEKQAAAYQIFGDPHDPTTYFGEQAVAATLIEASSLDYTILRPNTLTDESEIQELNIQTDRDQIIGRPISRMSVASLITKIILEPSLYLKESIAISKK